MNAENAEYGWKDSEATCAHSYLLPSVLNRIQSLFQGKPITVLDIGCGNGFVAMQLAQFGHSVVGVDASADGIKIARSAYPLVRFEVCSLYDDRLPDIVGTSVECIIALEVVEHLFYPKKLFEQSYRILKPGGYLIISTPYHGYLKNLAMSLLNAWDRHFTVHWEGGHIKFFSKKTLAMMATSKGLRHPRFHGVGRAPWLWKSMIMTVEK
jgi:2-polyprenyl-3-methyl-5-hydroxy-6-metoxy-1,4-benzoquinol methylase